jgi:hypothetical protein
MKKKNSNNNADPNVKNVEIPKKDVKGRGEDPNKKNETLIKMEGKDKPFNLTETLINFFKETFGDSGSKDKDKDKEKNQDKDKEVDEKSKEKIEELRKRREAENQRRARQERERQEYEAKIKSEQIRIENQKKEEKKKKEEEERAKFNDIIVDTNFEQIIQISLEKGETETLYLDLDSFTKIKMAVILTDTEEKINFVFSGPNARGRTSVLYKLDNKNYLFHEYEALRKGEYTIDLINRSSKEIELIFLINEHVDQGKKKDVLDTEKIDKISLLLNNIDNNVSQLRTKKRIEMRQANSHNDKVNSNNKSIVIYSIIEVFTMIIVFAAQSYYISSFVSKI